MSSQVLSSLSMMESYINYYLESVKEAELGLYWGVKNPKLCRINFEKKGNTHVNLMIPYATQKFTSEIYFNSLYPELGPDLIIEDKEYLANADVQCLTNSLSSFIEWNYTEVTSLHKTISELLKLYKNYQVELLRTHSEKLSLEYISIADRICLNNLEIVLGIDGKQVDATFLIKICLDQPIPMKKSIGLEVLVLVNFSGSCCSLIKPKICLSADLENLFNGSKMLQIPAFTENQRLIDYIFTLKNYLNEKVRDAVRCAENRKKFVSMLLVLHYKTVLEYDIATYRSISLYLADYNVILSFHLPINFPSEKFVLKVCTTQGIEQKIIRSKTVQDFPYDPEWHFKQMITNALSYIIEKEIN